MRYVRQFGAFLYDFLVGDAWELFLGPIIALVVGWALLQAGLGSATVGLVLFLGVLIVAAVNLVAGLRASA
ncbi:MAG TPA: hypothetical protein VGI98_03500 [Candidatus Limnocylindrales bacterium]|jgi:hypothetical protein